MTCFSLSVANYALDYIRRWRHTRGYGVHSPLAFRIVKECIHPDRRYGFYCDPYLDFEYHEDRRGLRRARLVIRLLNLLRPTHVWMPDADKRTVEAIRMIMPRMRVATQKECPKTTDFIICSDCSDTASLWKRMDSQKECGMLVFGKYSDCPDNNVSLEIDGKEFHILLRRIGMQKQYYEVIP